MVLEAEDPSGKGVGFSNSRKEGPEDGLAAQMCFLSGEERCEDNIFVGA